MNLKKYIAVTALLFAGAGFNSCETFNEFLDVVPDNRTELDTEDKIIAMLTSVYADNTFLTTAEFSSDNIDKLNVTYSTNDLYIAELAMWEEVTEVQNDAPSYVWQGQYGAIAGANQILAAIEDMYGSDSSLLNEDMRAAKGEALMARAYAHFILANVFCHAYSPAYAQTDLGLPYMLEAETTLNPKYERGTLSEFYACLAADIEEGLPLISDNISTVPKYHFGTKSANAFAARFYLYYQQYDKAIACANTALGSTVATDMRDLVTNKAYGWDNNGMNLYATLDYISSSHKCNLLLTTAMSQVGIAFGPFMYYTEYNHGYYLSVTETLFAASAPWGETDEGDMNLLSFTQSGSYDKVFAARVPYLFEYTDEVAQIGYPRTVNVPFTVEETLLTRAEAYVMNKDYESAMADMNIWIANFLVEPYTLTEANVTSWANKTEYYTYDKPTIKKAFEEPTMEIEMGSMQENLLHISSFLRRIETLHTGLRFFDIKRYGYTTYRRQLGAQQTDGSQLVTAILDQLNPRDERYAIQVPADVISAGFEPNPR